MRKTGITLGTGAAVLLLGAAVLILGGRKPFQNLSAADMVSATVRLTPPDRTVQIVELKELADYLEDVVIYREDNSFREYSGQGVVFNVTMSDGTQTEVMAYNPFLVLDGVGYRTKYEPCEALSQYANSLLEREDTVLVMEEPPALAVVSDMTSHQALRGSYSWQRIDQNGTSEGIQACGGHPLGYQKELQPALETTDGVAVLRFMEEPDEILSVRRWSDAHWGEPSAEGEEVAVNGYEIALKPGGYIYEVQAGWDTDSGYGGTASYFFYINLTE